jgi:hypothetical protein
MDIDSALIAAVGSVTVIADWRVQLSVELGCATPHFWPTVPAMLKAPFTP